MKLTPYIMLYSLQADATIDALCVHNLLLPKNLIILILIARLFLCVLPRPKNSALQAESQHLLEIDYLHIFDLYKSVCPTPQLTFYQMEFASLIKRSLQN